LATGSHQIPQRGDQSLHVGDEQDPEDTDDRIKRTRWKRQVFHVAHLKIQVREPTCLQNATEHP
jgi:hypothetical protein